MPVKISTTGSYVQAVKQLEHITGGLVKAGSHKVAVKDATLKVPSMTYNNADSAYSLRIYQNIGARKAQFPD